MHSKKRLVKQVLHTVMAMSIVYSSGLSVLVSKAGAMELLGVITDSNTEFSVKGIDGENIYLTAALRQLLAVRLV